MEQSGSCRLAASPFPTSLSSSFPAPLPAPLPTPTSLRLWGNGRGRPPIAPVVSLERVEKAPLSFCKLFLFKALPPEAPEIVLLFQTRKGERENPEPSMESSLSASLGDSDRVRRSYHTASCLHLYLIAASRHFDTIGNDSDGDDDDDVSALPVAGFHGLNQRRSQGRRGRFLTLSIYFK